MNSKVIRIDKNIVDFIRKVYHLDKFGKGTMSSVINRAIDYFVNKHEECFSCKYHMDTIAGLELGRQQLALKDIIANKTPLEPKDGEWIACDKVKLNKIRLMAKHCGRTGKNLIEQAVLEHLTRPPQCNTCKFYQEMTSQVQANNKLTSESGELS